MQMLSVFFFVAMWLLLGKCKTMKRPKQVFPLRSFHGFASVVFLAMYSLSTELMNCENVRSSSSANLFAVSTTVSSNVMLTFTFNGFIWRSPFSPIFCSYYSILSDKILTYPIK